MLNLDCIQHIIIHSDYDTTINFIQTCTHFASDSNIWKLKCQICYPSKPYFDFWLGRENYLVNQRDKFTLAINFSEYQCVSKYLYEYHPMIDDILNLSSGLIAYYSGYDIHKLINISVQAQYVVIKQDDNFDVKLIGHYTDNQTAIEHIIQDKLLIDADLSMWVIIDLAKIVPYFWSKISKFRSGGVLNPGKFY